MRAILIEKGKEPLVIPDLFEVDFDQLTCVLNCMNIKPNLVILEPAEDDDLEDWLVYFEDTVKRASYDIMDDIIIFS